MHAPPTPQHISSAPPMPTNLGMMMASPHNATQIILNQASAFPLECTQRRLISVRFADVQLNGQPTNFNSTNDLYPCPAYGSKAERYPSNVISWQLCND